MCIIMDFTILGKMMRKGRVRLRRMKVGIIGTGFIATAHTEAIRRTGLAEVAAICGSSLEKAEAAAEKCHIPKAYGSPEELIGDPSIEAVHNCTPNAVHYDISKKIIQAGKHVFSEKPLTLNSRESAELAELAERLPLAHGVNYNYRQYAMVQHMKARVEKGDLGRIHFIHGGYLQDWLLYEDDYNWRVEPEKGGPLRAIGDIGTHWMDLVQYITGQRITEVFAETTVVHPERSKPAVSGMTFGGRRGGEAGRIRVETEDFATVLLRFEDGMKGTVNVSQVSAGRKNYLHFEMNGDKSSMRWDQEEPYKLWQGHRDEPNQLLTADASLLDDSAFNYIHHPGGHNEGWPDAMKNMMIQYYRYIHQRGWETRKTPAFPTFADGHRGMLLLDAINESRQCGKWVRVEETAGIQLK